MILNKFYSRFSSIRIFSNIFTVTNQQYTLSADILPPTTQIGQNQEIRIKYPSNMLFSIIKSTQKYQKGAKPDYFSLRNIEMLQLGCWNWRINEFQYANNYKAIVGSLKEQKGTKYISLVFFDKHEKEGDKKKQFLIKVAQFVHFQDLIKSGINQYSNMRISQMSTVNSLINRINIKD